MIKKEIFFEKKKEKEKKKKERNLTFPSSLIPQCAQQKCSGCQTSPPFSI